MKCRGCGAEISWIKMPISGKAMPVDPEPVKVAYGEGSDTFVMGDGMMIVGKKLEDMEYRRGDEMVLEAYISHFATCPAAGKFRKGGGK
jgi:hypothetical protein